ncbi:roadblock/LC7 domain-containing protein [Natronosporangium hydrolyticum]|uniref:Roadblock/LC7 domain-containing protein n=1 Tax=Natronosporangium hydrolyticum TaxID=2811111 RepID=A0A895Y693_9ACTN|nr:roadblock/LC7 domain-containing protein [Natronosporangium hydrolyticum]QSB13267.1 roadblock/LC7 domain-containing protein [Natronosporangium hydrolyticum]
MTSSNDLNWLLQNFVQRTQDVSHALAISTDGMVLAHNEGLPRDRADQLAATGSGLVALLTGAARFFEAGAMISNVTQLEGGFMFCIAFSQGASLLVLAAPTCDVGKVSYEMTDLAIRMGEALTPAPRATLA